MLKNEFMFMIKNIIYYIFDTLFEPINEILFMPNSPFMHLVIFVPRLITRSHIFEERGVIMSAQDIVH